MAQTLTLHLISKPLVKAACDRTKVRITKSEISMRTWRSPMNAASQGAFVVIPEISHSDISYITIQVHPKLGACFGAHAVFFVSTAATALTPRPQGFLQLAVRVLPSVYRYSPCASSALTAACAAASLAIGTRNGEQDT